MEGNERGGCMELRGVFGTRIKVLKLTTGKTLKLSQIFYQSFLSTDLIQPYFEGYFLLK